MNYENSAVVQCGTSDEDLQRRPSASSSQLSEKDTLKRAGEKGRSRGVENLSELSEHRSPVSKIIWVYFRIA